MSRRSLTLVASPVIFAVLLTVLSLPTPAIAQTTQVVEYYHTDALGSVRAVTNQSGVVIRRHDFLPFGEELQPTVPPPDKPLFTGKERDAETGLDYFGPPSPNRRVQQPCRIWRPSARYQRAGVGRFTSVDPLMTLDKNLADPQRWNRYACVRCNPLRFIDSDGRAIGNPDDQQPNAGQPKLGRCDSLTPVRKRNPASVDSSTNEAVHFRPNCTAGLHGK